MEDRQRIEADVGEPQIEAGFDLGDVGEEIGVRQRHALWRAFRAGGEQHDRRIVGLGPCERGPGAQRGAEFIHRRRAGAHVLEPDDARTRPDRLDLGSEIGLVDEGAGGQHEADERLFAGGGQIVRRPR